MQNTCTRHILHCDCNAYFASVEELFNPQLKKVPMAVCGNPENRHGIILAKNELAKRQGVKTAETIWSAKQKCPQLVLCPPRRGEYSHYCNLINTQVYENYTDLVERAGVDESYLDITGTLHLFKCTPLELANRIREEVEQKTGLTISVGVSYNKIFAKLGSDYKKPNAVTEITAENYKRIVWPLPVSDMFFVGKATAETLRGMHINTIGDIAAAPAEYLKLRLGKIGEQIHIFANGADESPVVPQHSAPDVQTVGNGMTFRRNLITKEDIRTAVLALSDSVAARLRKNYFKCFNISVTIKDEKLKVITRQKTLVNPTWISEEIAGHATALVYENWSIGRPIRMLTITAGKLALPNEAVEQTSLFEQLEAGQHKDYKKQEKLEIAVDKLHQSYGKSSVYRGSAASSDIGIDPKDHTE